MCYFAVRSSATFFTMKIGRIRPAITAAIHTITVAADGVGKQPNGGTDEQSDHRRKDTSVRIGPGFAWRGTCRQLEPKSGIYLLWSKRRPVISMVEIRR